MELIDGTLLIEPFLTVTLGIIVLFVGKRLNDRILVLREFSIPEPVTGGLLFSVLFGIVYATSSVWQSSSDLGARDILLVYFFTTIGINASLKDLLAGGKPLVILLVITIAYMIRAEPDRHFRGGPLRSANPCRTPGRHGVTDRRPWHGDRLGAPNRGRTTESPMPWRSASPVRPSV